MFKLLAAALLGIAGLAAGLGLADTGPPTILSTQTVVTLGLTSVSGLAYVASCDGLPLHYCGAVPDMGAVEG
jgi:hypothetical protein